MGVNIKQATYCGPGVSGTPPVPESGEPQPVLDTSNNSPIGPGVNFVQNHWVCDHAGPTHTDPGAYLPTGGSIPTDSTDVQNPESQGSDQTPADIFKGSKSNG